MPFVVGRSAPVSTSGIAASALRRKRFFYMVLARPACRTQTTGGGLMAVTIYMLKPAFIRLLRPVAAFLVAKGATANHVTFAACLVSCALGAALFVFP